MAACRIVIDHLGGVRRGHRQELPEDTRVRFGRHPECEVSFDAHRDIDASSRHAELRHEESGWVLVDLGSSNGTYVDGHRATESPVAQNVPVILEFGSGGPRVRLFIGDDAEIAALPPAPVEVTKRTWLWPSIAGGIAVIAVAIMLVRC